jgi:hypothetical protein
MLLHCRPLAQVNTKSFPRNVDWVRQKAIRHPPKARGLIKPPRCSADRVLDDLVTILSPLFQNYLEPFCTRGFTSTLEGVLMDRAAEYRRHAADCFAVAQHITDPHLQATMLKMSRCWSALADRQRAGEVEDHHVPPPETDDHIK